jgi:hypothetical protein
VSYNVLSRTETSYNVQYSTGRTKEKESFFLNIDDILLMLPETAGNYIIKNAVKNDIIKGF